ERYDDLVFVRWRYSNVGDSPKSPPPSTKIVNVKLSFQVGDGLKIRVTRIQGPSTFGLHIIDCEVENVGKSDLDLSGFELRATHGGHALENQSVVYGQDKLKSREKTRARIVMKIGAKADFFIEGKTKSAAGKVLVSRKLL